MIAVLAIRVAHVVFLVQLLEVFPDAVVLDALDAVSSFVGLVAAVLACTVAADSPAIFSSLHDRHNTVNSHTCH